MTPSPTVKEPEDADDPALTPALCAMLALSDDDRLQVMAHFCRGCGGIQPEDRGCTCTNDT